MYLATPMPRTAIPRKSASRSAIACPAGCAKRTSPSFSRARTARAARVRSLRRSRRRRDAVLPRDGVRGTRRPRRVARAKGRAIRAIRSTGDRGDPQALDALHRGQALHRDLTPFNVSSARGEQLKLGDFGIATHQLSRRGVTAEAFNSVPCAERDCMGQSAPLAAARRHLSGRARSRRCCFAATSRARCAASDVRSLPCSDHLKEVIHRCLGSAATRYEAASELIAALRQRPKEPRLGRVKSLTASECRSLAFSSRPRREAIAAAKKAGAIVQSKPGQRPTCWCAGGRTSCRSPAKTAAEADRDSVVSRRRDTR